MGPEWTQWWTTWAPTFSARLSAPFGPVAATAFAGATTGLRTELHLGRLFSQQKEIYGVAMGTKEDMRQIVAVLNQGVIHPAIDRTFPLANAADAHRAMEQTNFFGKLLLTV